MGGRYGRYWGRMYLVSFGSFVYIHWGEIKEDWANLRQGAMFYIRT